MEPWLCHSNTLTGVFFVKGEAMLDIKRIRTDFDAVAKKIGNTWRRCSYFEWNEKKSMLKRRDILVKVENLKAERNTVSA